MLSRIRYRFGNFPSFLKSHEAVQSGAKHASGFVVLIILLEMFAAIFGATPLTQAAILRQLPFSARLRAAGSGLVVPNGNYSLTFSIYTAATDGAAVWTEAQTVSVTDGLVYADLGSVTAFPGSLSFDGATYYLGIKIGADPEAVPRRKIGAVPSAFNADAVSGLNIGTGANNILALDSSGNLSLSGNIATTGTLQAATATLATLNTASGNLTIAPAGGTTVVTGALTVSGTTTVSGNILPGSDLGADLGSSTRRFNNAYIANLAVDTLNTTGSTASTFTINSDAAGDETSTLAFYRGGALAAAQITWNATSGLFDLNRGVSVAGTISSSASSNQIVLQSAGVTGTITWTPTTTNKTITLPDASTTLVGIDTSQTLTNKTVSGGTIQGTISGGAGLTLPAYTASGNITGSGSPVIASFGTINGATLSGGTLSGGSLSAGTYTGTSLQGTGSYTITGGTASGETLTLVSTTNATKGDIQFFSASNKITSGGNLTIVGTFTAATVNATTGLQLNGTSINTAGALSNVAYLDQTNTFSVSGAASTPATFLTGVWYSGGTATTTKPQLLIEPTGATSTAWSTSGTGLGVNAATGFAGNLVDLQLNGASKLSVTSAGALTAASTINGATLSGGTLSGGSLSATAVNGLSVAAGSITVGTWNATAISATKGGTGIDTSASTGLPTISSGTWSIAASLGATQGGTGQTTVTTGDLLYGSATNTWGKLADVATGSVLIAGGIGVAPSWSAAPTLTTSLTVPLLQTAAGDLTIAPNSGIAKLLTTSTQGKLRVYASDGAKYTEISHDATNGTITASSGELQLGSSGDLIIGAVSGVSNLVFEENATISGQGGNTITVGVNGDTIDLGVASVTYKINRIKATQATAPTSGTPTNCGTSPSSAVTSGATDSAGQFTITSGSGSPTTCDTVVTFNTAYGAAPKALLVSPMSANAAARQVYVSASSTTTFTIKFGSNAAASTAYLYSYRIIE